MTKVARAAHRRGASTAAEVHLGASAVTGVLRVLSSRVGLCPPPRLPSLSQPDQRQTLLLIRHGEGWHNTGYDHNEDAHLTPRGWAQAAALQQHLMRLQSELNIQVRAARWMPGGRAR